MTNAERKEPRREAAPRRPETRSPADIARQRATSPDRDRDRRGGTRRARAAEQKRMIDLRTVMTEASEWEARATSITAHPRRWSHRPTEWTAEQIDTARRFFQGFIRTDGTHAAPDPQEGRWRL